MEGLTGLYAKLKLQINPAKSAVAPVAERTFLGYRFWRVVRGRIVKRRVAPKAIDKMKARVRELTARSNGRSIKQVVAALRRYVLGWQAYFRLAETPNVFAELDGWIRRRLRALIMKQCKHGRKLFRVLRAREGFRSASRPRRPRIVVDGGPSRLIVPSKLPFQASASMRSAYRAWVPHQPQLSEPPDADPYVRWCGREVGELNSPTPYPDFVPLQVNSGV